MTELISLLKTKQRNSVYTQRLKPSTKCRTSNPISSIHKIKVVHPILKQNNISRSITPYQRVFQNSVYKHILTYKGPNNDNSSANINKK